MFIFLWRTHFLVDEIVEKYNNQYSDIVFVEPFLSYINEEKVLEKMIVQNINKSLIPEKPKSDKSPVMSGLSHVTSPEYFQNNATHIIVIVVFLSILTLLMVNRGLEFYSTIQLN